MTVRVFALGWTLAAAAACTSGSGNLPNSPTSDSNNAGTISGRVVEHTTGQPVGGVSIVVAGRAGITDGTGRFALTGVPPAGIGGVTASGPDILFRSVMLQLAPNRSDVDLDVLRDGPLFSSQFYRYFVRNGLDSGTLAATLPWTMNPSFYARTIVDGTEIRVDPEVVARIEANFRLSVPELSGGRLRVDAFESGEEVRPAREGWVNIFFVPQVAFSSAFGRASVGGNQGIMELRWFGPPGRDINELNCFSMELFTADHEITHTMGFWHTPDPIADSFSGEGCRGAPRAAHARYHANVMYSRPRGNRDPDIDPSNIVHASPPATDHPSVVTCRFDRRGAGQ